MSEIWGSYSTQKEQPKAFPSTGPVANHGMDLRDWFAGMALQGLTAHRGNGVYVVYSAYEIADAMMKMREKK